MTTTATPSLPSTNSFHGPAHLPTSRPSYNSKAAAQICRFHPSKLTFPTSDCMHHRYKMMAERNWKDAHGGNGSRPGSAASSDSGWGRTSDTDNHQNKPAAAPGGQPGPTFQFCNTHRDNKVRANLMLRCCPVAVTATPVVAASAMYYWHIAQPNSPYQLHPAPPPRAPPPPPPPPQCE